MRCAAPRSRWPWARTWPVGNFRTGNGRWSCSWESAPQSSFEPPHITNLLQPPAAELEFPDRRQVRREPGSTIELDCAGVLREHPCADGLEPLFEHARSRAAPEPA